MLNMETLPKLDQALELLAKIVSNKEGGEDRPQQKEMIKTLCGAIDDFKPAMIEAGTGSGKSFAELIPASIYASSESRWVISTATIQLSDQLGKLDMPFLETHIPNLKGRWSVLKGRSNYLCMENVSKIKRLNEEAESLFEGESNKENLPQEAVEVSQIMEWEQETKTGDRANAPSVSDKVWKQFSRSSSACPGAKKCPFGDVCFAEKAISKAHAADIVITNHALVAHDLASRSEGTKNPPLGQNLGVIVFDETHELESYLSEAWGAEISKETLKEWDFQLKALLGKTKEESRKEFSKHIESMLKGAVIEGKKAGKSFLVPPEEDFPVLIQMHIGKAVNEIEKIVSARIDDDSKKASLYSLRSSILETLNSISNTDESVVRWIEYDSMSWKKGADPVAKIKVAPLMIGPLLKSFTRDAGINTIFTSATIRVSGNFEIPSTKLSVESALGLSLGSPFNFKKQGILGIPDFTIPKGDERETHFNEFKQFSLDVISALEGRTLVLCTSKKNTVAMAEYLEENGVNVIDTVNNPQSFASSQFKENPEIVLVGTYGVWQGLDVPGESLQAVLIEKIPFGRVDDMLSNARSKYWDSQGESGFMLESIAGAQTRLNQAVGRLIRSKDDKGIVVIADPRMKTTSYGKTLTRGLPSFYRLDDKEKIIQSCINLAKSRRNNE